MLPSWYSPSWTDLSSGSPMRHGIDKEGFQSLVTQGAAPERPELSRVLLAPFPASEPCPAGLSWACSELLGSSARGAGALKVTPEGAEHLVQVPKPGQRQLRPLERAVLPWLGSESVPGDKRGHGRGSFCMNLY